MGLAVIAGAGALPRLLLDARGGVAVRLAGVPCETGDHPVIPARFERLGALFEDLRAQGATEVVMAGAMSRPALDPAQFDTFSLAAMPKLLPLLQAGDDALLRGVIALFEDQGLAVRGAHEILPDLVVEAGTLVGAPDAQLLRDAARGREILQVLGDLDIGQGCVMNAGQVLGMETIYGTDAMLDSVARLRAERMPSTGGVLVKRAKPGQDLRVDMPAIGPETVQNALRAGLTGICLQAGHVIVFDRARVVEMSEQSGLALWAED